MLGEAFLRENTSRPISTRPHHTYGRSSIHGARGGEGRPVREGAQGREAAAQGQSRGEGQAQGEGKARRQGEAPGRQ